MDNPIQILVIEDEAALRKLLEIVLQSNGFEVRMAVNAKDGKIMAAGFQPDLILMDLGLPDEDGQQLLQVIREWYTRPVIILSARSEEAEIVQALDNGANDYLCKPFRTGELLARIRSALRQQPGAAQTVDPVKTFGALSIDQSRRLVTKDNETLKLTTTEYALLLLFVRNEGKVLTHQFILREIWGPGYVERTEYPRVFVGQLRKKIEQNPNQPSLIQTESGIGYRFVGP